MTFYGRKKGQVDQ